MNKGRKPDSAIKFRNFCFNKKLSATDIAEALYLRTATVYKYWSGDIAVPDENKKILEEKFGLDIYDIFYKEL